MQDSTHDPFAAEKRRRPLPPGIWRAGVSVLFLAALAVLAIQLSGIARFPLQRVREALHYPFQLDAEEGYILGQAMRFAAGLELYPSINDPPYLVDNYPPVYPVLWSCFVDLSAPSLSAGRWISALSAGAAALAIAFIILFQSLMQVRPKSAADLSSNPQRETEKTETDAAEDPTVLRETPTGPDQARERGLFFGGLGAGQTLLIALFSPILFLTSNELLRWAAYTRVDLLAVAFALWGLAVFALWGGRSAWGRGAAIALFALSLLTKQTVVAAPVACFVWLLPRDRRAAFRFALWMAIAAVVPVALLCAATGGRYWLHTVTYNRNVMYWNDLWRWLLHVWRLYHYLLLAAAALLVWTAWDRKARVSLWQIYFLLNALSLVSLAKAGSAENYLLEPQAALALFVGTCLNEALRRAQRAGTAGAAGRARSERGVACAVAAAVLVLVFLHAALFRKLEPVLFHGAPRPSLEALQKGKRVVRLIQERRGPVLSEDPIYAFLGDQPAEFQHFIMTQLTAEGKWDETPFVERVKRRAFSLVVAHQDIGNEGQFFNRYSPALRRALRENYALIETLPRPQPLQTIFVYAPR